MAKSIRSKVKRFYRSIRRKDIFGPVEEERLQKMAARQAGESVPDAPPKRFSFLERTEPPRAVFVNDMPRDTHYKVAETDDSAMSVDLSCKVEKDRLFMSRNQFKKKMISKKKKVEKQKRIARTRKNKL